jgi:hypothetical protein
MTEPFLLSRVLLNFEPDNSLCSNLSASAQTPDGSLWLGSDEMSLVDQVECNTLERLSQTEPQTQPCQFGQHQTFKLRDFFDLANEGANEASEVDIEGLDYDGSYLWLTGSHSTKRKKPKGKNLQKDILRLAEVATDPNRYLLARIPVVNGQLYKSCPDPQHPNRTLTAACLKRRKQSNQLMAALQDDPHLGAFVANHLPSKENGFDIEGLAVHQNRIFLGLRGPVLRGWAMLLEIELEESAGDLQLKSLGAKPYRKHFLKLDGLGIRDLCFRGEQLLILAGPTMDLAGTQRVYCWQNPLEGSGDSVQGLESTPLKVLFDLPFSPTGDKAEGISLFTCLGEPGLMVLYDSPHPNRVTATGVFADVFRLPD